MSKLMTYRAGNDARDFFKNVDVPLEAGTGYLIEPTEVQTIIYEGFEGDRKMVNTTIPVLDPHELLDFLQAELQLQCPMDKVRAYWKHLRDNGYPFAKNFPARNEDLDCMVPFTIYGDELTLGKDSRDKVTGIFLQLTLFSASAIEDGIAEP
ncbi:PLCXD2 [Symbiodinium necroappetens]|uniref:PLCXD2 protein n=1 Tax=Symbiodinium necroappetens TaxID=1628268 RepID=A0A812QR99_9DINO|nr:PLCXD2 [Symbiodinium necroappetens]